MSIRNLKGMTPILLLGLALLAGPALAGNVDELRRGMKQAKVEERLGAPKEKHGPVGDPPISSWVYDGFSVYFEHDLLLHIVNTNKACPLCEPHEAAPE